MPFPDPPKRCPSCGELTLVPYLLGLPTEEAMEAAQRNEVVLGGCCVLGIEPDEQCTSCGHQEPPASDAYWMCGTPDLLVDDDVGIDAAHGPGPVDVVGAEQEIDLVAHRARALATAAHAGIGLALAAGTLEHDLDQLVLPTGGRELVDRASARLAGAVERAEEVAAIALRTARRAGELRSAVREAADEDAVVELLERAAATELHLPPGEELAVDAVGEVIAAATALWRVALGATVLGEPLDEVAARRLVHRALAVAATADVGLPEADGVTARAGHGYIGTRPALWATDASGLRSELAGVVARAHHQPTWSCSVGDLDGPLGAVRILSVPGGVVLRHEPPGSWREGDPEWQWFHADTAPELVPAVDAAVALVTGVDGWADGELTAILDGGHPRPPTAPPGSG